MRGGDLLQYASSWGTGTREASVTERAVAHDGDAVRFAPGDHGVLDCALTQMVEDLIADETARAADRPRLVEIGRIEVAHAPREDLPVPMERLEGRKRFRERVAPPPMQELAVQPVGTEARERPLAGRYRPAPGGVLGKDLGNQEDVVAPPDDRFRDDLFDDPRALHRSDLRADLGDGHLVGCDMPPMEEPSCAHHSYY